MFSHKLYKYRKMTKLALTLILLITGSLVFAQIDKEQLALDVGKAENANREKLKDYIWKRYSTATVDGEKKATVITEFSFDEKGNINVIQVGGESSVKKKPGIRGRIQENAIENKVEYVEKALNLALKYTYMSKGQLLDFFDKGTVTDKGNALEVAGGNVIMKGDSLTVLFDKKTKLYISKKFSSLLDDDPINGEIQYEKFNSGINHGSETILNLPAKKAKIEAKNQDYSKRIQ